MAVYVNANKSHRSDKYENINYRKKRRNKYPEFKDYIYSHKICCAYCGKKFRKRRDITIEHIDAISHGGDDELHNIVAAHKKCNKARGCIENYIYYLEHPKLITHLFNYIEEMRLYKPKGFNYSKKLYRKLMKILNLVRGANYGMLL